MTFINRKGRIFLTKKLTNQLIGVTSGRNFRELEVMKLYPVKNQDAQVAQNR